MSKPISPRAPTIPVGILVSAALKPSKPQRPALAKKPSAPERPVPWLWIAASGSILWVLIVAVVGMCSMVQDRPQPRHESSTLASNPPVVAPVVLPAPLPLLDEGPGGERGSEPAPVPGIEHPVILLPPNRLPPVDYMPMPIEITPEPPAPPVPAPPAPPLKRPRQLVDTKVYANCEDIGSDVLFVRNPIDAFKRAKAEKKILFMVHLSGNLEDPGCT